MKNNTTHKKNNVKHVIFGAIAAFTFALFALLGSTGTASADCREYGDGNRQHCSAGITDAGKVSASSGSDVRSFDDGVAGTTSPNGRSPEKADKGTAVTNGGSNGSVKGSIKACPSTFAGSQFTDQDNSGVRDEFPGATAGIKEACSD